MKSEQAKLLFDRSILSFGSSLADLVFEAQLLVHIHKSVQSGETITFNSSNQTYTHSSIGNWWHSISADDLTRNPGSRHFYIGIQKGDKTSITTRFKSTLNSQFRWLLVSGYEAYEQFLVRFYAELGFCDYSLWRCADFGNRYHLKKIPSLQLNDYLQRVRESPKLRPEKIRNLLACLFPTIQQAEDQNSIAFCDEVISYKNYIDMIAEMRHIIVHNQSQVDRDNFFQRLKKKWERNSELSQRLKSLISQNELRRVDSSWEIWLLNESAISPESCTHIDSSLQNLLERLGSHACLLYGESIKHFGHAPFWER